MPPFHLRLIPFYPTDATWEDVLDFLPEDTVWDWDPPESELEDEAVVAYRTVTVRRGDHTVRLTCGGSRLRFPVRGEAAAHPLVGLMAEKLQGLELMRARLDGPSSTEPPDWSLAFEVALPIATILGAGIEVVGLPRLDGRFFTTEAAIVRLAAGGPDDPPPPDAPIPGAAELRAQLEASLLRTSLRILPLAAAAPTKADWEVALSGLDVDVSALRADPRGTAHGRLDLRHDGREARIEIVHDVGHHAGLMVAQLREHDDPRADPIEAALRQGGVTASVSTPTEEGWQLLLEVAARAAELLGGLVVGEHQLLGSHEPATAEELRGRLEVGLPTGAEVDA
jgi:hypothetical protein